MTLLEIKTAAAHYLELGVADLTVNTQDLGILALNQVRKFAELNHDFEFSRKLVTVSVDGVTGGDLTTAVLYGTATAASIKTVIDVGIFDEDGNLRPIEWTTVSESLERGRLDNPAFVPRFPTDGQALGSPVGRSRVAFSGDKVYLFPLGASGETFTLGMEVYTFTADWVIGATEASTSPWSTHGSQFLLWQTVVHLNKRFKYFVPRTEGNLPAPTDLADAGLQAFKDWDTYRYEQSRRHGR